MTSDEIKQNLSMRDVVQQYGITVNRSGMCCCPFHGERHASMKIYKDSYNCFACGANGDIFTFVQNMDGVDFKTAFLTLGGSYKKLSNREKVTAKITRNVAAAKRNDRAKVETELREALIAALDLAKETIKNYEPLSDAWCEAQNFLPKAQEWWQIKFVNGEEVNEVDVYRKCCQFRQDINSLSTASR